MNRIVRLAALATSVFLTFAVAGAEADNPAAVVLRADCGNSECLVKRASTVTPLSVFEPLYPGDRITVRGHGEVEISTADRQLVRVAATRWREGRYIVVPPRAPQGPLARLWVRLAALFERGEALTLTAGVYSGHRGEPGELSAFCGTPPEIRLHVVAGERTLAVPVAGVGNLFRMVVKDEAGHTLADSGLIAARWLTTPKIRLVPGRIAIDLYNDTGHSLLLDVEVAGAAPAMPKEYEMPDGTDAAKAVMRLAWLAEVEDGKWIAEAAAEAAETSERDTVPKLFQRCTSMKH